MDLLFRRDLLAQGWTEAELRRERRAGRLPAVRPGTYLDGSGPAPETPEARHACLVRATLPHLSPGWVPSHVSAAVLLGLPVWNQPLDRVHVSRDGNGGGRVTRGVHRHVLPLRSEETVMVDGIRVTAPARTVVDLAGVTGFEEGIVVADAALAPRPRGRVPLTDRSELLDALDRRGRNGRSAARRVVLFADGGSRSPGESRSRVALWRAGLPAPVLQFEVRAADGRRLGFADFGWPELRTVGEFDGRVKYGRLVPAGRTAAEVVYAEKLREDAMRGTDLGMVRWIWPDLTNFDPVAARLRRTFRAAAHLPASRAWPDMRS